MSALRTCIGVALMVNKSPKCSTWVQLKKRQSNTSLFPKQIIQHHSNPSLCPNYRCKRSRSWLVLWRPTTPSTNTQKKRCPFHHRRLECKSRRYVRPWSTKWSKAKANRVWSREHAAHSRHPFPTTQETTLDMDITWWSILKSDWLYSLQQRWTSSIQWAELRPGADCGWAPYCKIQT